VITSMKRVNLIKCFLISATLAVSGCYTTTGTLSREPVGYLQLSGVREGLTAMVDDLQPVAIAPTDGQARLQVSPGRHRIRVQQGETVLVDRTILVSDQQTLEISVP
jgi:hypothetical protein